MNDSGPDLIMLPEMSRGFSRPGRRVGFDFRFAGVIDNSCEVVRLKEARGRNIVAIRRVAMRVIHRIEITESAL